MWAYKFYFLVGRLVLLGMIKKKKIVTIGQQKAKF